MDRYCRHCGQELLRPGGHFCSGCGRPTSAARLPPQYYGLKTTSAKELAWRFETVRAMSGAQFELYVADLLRAMGHTTRVLGGAGDQGVDLIVDYFGERVAVQCKNYAKPVGNRPVQEVFAGARHHGCQQAWVVAPAGFTNGAFELARSVGVKLFDSASIRTWVGEVDKAVSPHPPSESFPPTYPTSELRKQDSESYHTLLDDYEMELIRLERVRADLATNSSKEDRSSKANVLKILLDTQARIFDIGKQLDAFEKLGTGSLEQKQRHSQLEARHKQADQEAQRHGVGQISSRRKPRTLKEDPLVVWSCALPTIGCLAVGIVFVTAMWTFAFGAGFGESFVYGFLVLGGIVGLTALLMYAAHKRYGP
jgi:hypothetical protein